MSNEIACFQFGGKNIRVIRDREGKSWWPAKDVCQILGLSNSSQAMSRLKENEKGVTKMDTLGGEQTISIMNEPGLYRLIFRSNKPEAEAFKDWVYDELLPTIRKTGRFEPSLAQPPYKAPIPPVRYLPKPNNIDGCRRWIKNSKKPFTAVDLCRAVNREDNVPASLQQCRTAIRITRNEGLWLIPLWCRPAHPITKVRPRCGYFTMNPRAILDRQGD